MSGHQTAERGRWLPFGMGLVAGLVLAELLAISMAYSTPLVDLLQALDFAVG